MKRRMLSIITALALCLGLCPTWAFAAEGDPATESVEYQEASWDNTQVIYTDKSESCTPVTADTTTWDAGWYAVSGIVTISGGIVDATGGAADSSGDYAGDPIGNGGNANGTATVNKTTGIVFENGAGTVCGNVTFDGSYDVPAGYTLNIPAGASLSGSGTCIATGTYGTKLSELTVDGSWMVNSESGAGILGRWAIQSEATPDVGTYSETATFIPVTGADSYLPLTAPVAVTITKATAAPTPGMLEVQNKAAKTYTYNLEQLLPDPPKGMSLGTVSYALGAVNITGGYYDISSPATISGNTLTLPIQAVDTEALADIGTVSVTITSQNFEDMTATITVKSVNKTTVDISGVTLAGRAYNGKAIELSGTPIAKADGQTVNVTKFAYTLTVSVDPEDPTYTGSTKLSVTIEQAEIKITAPSRTIYVGESAPTFSAPDCTISGLAAGESLKTPPTVAYADTPDTSKTGSVAVTASGAEVPDSGNYKEQIVYLDGALTIANKPSPPPVAKQYAITYNSNGGNGTMASGTATDGKASTLPGCSFTPPEGKVFDAWAVGSPDGPQVKAGGSVTFTADTTLYAVWKALSGGSTNTEVEVKPGTSPVTVGGLDSIFQDETVYTPEDKEIVAAGGTVKFKLVVEKQDNPPAAGKIEAVKPIGQTIGLYLDLSILKIVTQNGGTETTTTVPQVGSLILTIIPLPAELQGKSGYTVYREHDGVAEALPSSGSTVTLTVTPNSGLFLFDKKEHIRSGSGNNAISKGVEEKVYLWGRKNIVNIWQNTPFHL